MTNIKDIEIGEIVTIKNRDWILVETPHKNGTMEWMQPTLVLLDKILKGINKKPYYRKNKIVVEPVPTKMFRCKTLTNKKGKNWQNRKKTKPIERLSATINSEVMIKDGEK